MIVVGVGLSSVIFVDEFCRVEGEDDDDVENYEDEKEAGSHGDLESHDFVRQIDLFSYLNKDKEIIA